MDSSSIRDPKPKPEEFQHRDRGWKGDQERAVEGGGKPGERGIMESTEGNSRQEVSSVSVLKALTESHRTFELEVIWEIY